MSVYISNIFSNILEYSLNELNKETIISIIQTALDNMKNIIKTDISSIFENKDKVVSSIEFNIMNIIPKILEAIRDINEELLNDILSYEYDMIDKLKLIELISGWFDKQNNKNEEVLIKKQRKYYNLLRLQNIYEAIEDGNYDYE
jgi:hypothetical protein